MNPAPSPKPIRLAVLLSGGGRSLQNLIDRIAAGKLTAQISLVIGSRSGIGGLDRARAAGIKTEIVDRRQFPSTDAFSGAIFDLCHAAQADLVCLAGWLSLIAVPSAWNGRVMNIHPALLPAFGGKGMYGHHVHEAVLRAGHKTSGCTVHFVDAEYDHGPIILQRTCRVLPNDTPDSLARRVFDEETIAYPQAIQLFQQRRLKLENGRVLTLP